MKEVNFYIYIYGNKLPVSWTFSVSVNREHHFEPVPGNHANTKAVCFDNQYCMKPPPYLDTFQKVTADVCLGTELWIVLGMLVPKYCY